MEKGKAAKAGLKAGTEIISVNLMDFWRITHSDAAAILWSEWKQKRRLEIISKVNFAREILGRFVPLFLKYTIAR